MFLPTSWVLLFQVFSLSVQNQSPDGLLEAISLDNIALNREGEWLLSKTFEIQMDTEELIRKCKAITLKGGEEMKVSFKSEMKSKGEKIVAGCLIGKVLTSRNVNKEGLKIAMQQAWQTIREVKIDAMGENIFIFRFATETDKRRASAGGPWHFNGALIIFTEPTGIGEVSKQSFTNASFWVQLKNVPIMCMDKGTISELGAAIGRVEEVWTDANGECTGEIIRLRISIDITKPLMTLLSLEQEDGEEDAVPITIQYEKLPDFCFCCGCVGHQYRECTKFKNQAKEELLYGPWIKATTMVDKLKQHRGKERWNITTNEQKAKSSSNQIPLGITELQGQNTTDRPGQEDGLNPTRKSKEAEMHSMQEGGFSRLLDKNGQTPEDVTSTKKIARQQELEGVKGKEGKLLKDSQKLSAEHEEENGKKKREK